MLKNRQKEIEKASQIPHDMLEVLKHNILYKGTPEKNLDRGAYIVILNLIDQYMILTKKD